MQPALRVSPRIFKRNGAASSDRARYRKFEHRQSGKHRRLRCGFWFFSHAVAKTNEDLKALVSSAPAIIGHGLFVPARNADLIRWLLGAGFRTSWPANLMPIGQYNEPSAPYLPSIAY